MERRLRSVHTSVPGIVQSYDSTLQTVSVRPVVKFQKPDGTYADPPILDEVPIAWAGAGDFAITYPLAKGDGCLVLFSEEDPAGWFFGGDVEEPEIQKRFGWYAVAIPMQSRALVNPMLPTQIDSDAVVISKSPGVPPPDYVALATKVDLLWTTLDTVLRTAWVVVPTDGGAALKVAYAAAFPVPPTSVAASNLKVT